jgi:membrane-associated phospholipid phosphatase
VERELRRLFWVGIAYALATAASIAWLDAPLAHWIATFEKPALAGQAIRYLEYAAGVEPWIWATHTALVAAVLATAFVPRLRRWAPQVQYIALVHLLVRNLTLWGKGATGRLRPLEWLHDGGPQWLAHGVAFPSGHVAIFGSLAVAIAMAFPRAWPVLVAIPIAAAARISVDAHYASDCLGAVALICFVAWACGPVLTRRADSAR